MAKLVLESHASALGAHGFKKKVLSNGNHEYTHSSGHSFIVHKNGSWAHFGPNQKVASSVSNPDTGILLKKYLDNNYRH